ncbi:aryl-alcohol dehydrogenase [Penicillium sp. DV-2018c]|nr:aryl-alcohol dehydrogenase [Penicillium sp. DV-2018c]
MPEHEVFPSLEDFLKAAFDYIIVGGGTAGLVLAARLSEDPSLTVGVLEAGNCHLGNSDVDSMFGMGKMLHDPKYDWVFKTTPQKHNADKIHHLPRGKMLGGSSGINFMAHVRPSVEDIDSWSAQAPGWTWAALAPYFRKSESLLPDTASSERPGYLIDSTCHGKTGPIQVSPPKWVPEIDEEVMRALCQATGTLQPENPYSGEHLGFAHYLSTVDRRDRHVSRSYAATGYFELCRNRPNLKVLTDASVSRVLLEGSPIYARGVQFRHGGSQHEVSAKNEVVLSASTIQSPRLLELSGIGRPEILQSAGIPCLVNLPQVGENLQEHPLSCVTYELTDAPEHILLDSLRVKQDVLQAHLSQLHETQDGLLSGISGLIGFAPLAPNVSESRMNSTIDAIVASQTAGMAGHQLEQSERIIRLLRNPRSPILELVGMACNFDISAGHNDQSRLVAGPPPASNDCYTVLVSSLYNMSRGSTHITAPSAVSDSFSSQDVQIDLAFLEHEADVNILAVGLKMANRAFLSKDLSQRVKRRVAPPPEVDLEDDVQAAEYVRKNIMMFNHNLGTCAMGRVVDERLRVKGVGNLRVVDCSVIPDQISANPMATVYALAERASDLIKEDSKSKV